MLSDRLVELRKSKELTQQGLADKLKITRSSLSQYEIGNRQPDYETLKKIADFFEVTTDYLLGYSNTKPVVEEEKTPYNVTDDPDLQIAFKDAADFSEEARRQTIDFINYLKEKEKSKGRKSSKDDD
ncbi:MULTISPECIES: helix-turn-helix domain-containing protein [Bacillus subtilis group]|uniref:helix-turn-helix domain-containing protein n=1 Tax=Bacillus subtilis group TaxID=653685 RepID=UPI000FFDFE3E|nr:MULTISPECIES: helix-turn-helix transcriptional regulator [Bacillus subtilis group]MCU9592248.1 helix-turn-helix transcriptional regulator [Bacillus velezensis]QAT57046.1 XRE family transcriptional regulator [Bacillus subtilis]QHM06562.1 HTH-type transcriptional regulator Xre [Bacillus subtilis]